MQKDNPLGLPTEITFTGDKKQQQLLLMNPTDSPYVFKIKSTDRDSLQLKVFEGFIEPGITRSINILLKRFDAKREKKIKLLVQWASADMSSKEKRIESFQKSEVRSHQIIINEVEIEQPIIIPIDAPQIPPKQNLTIPLDTSDSASTLYEQKLESQKARYAQLNKTAEVLKMQYNEMLEASSLKNSNVKSNAAVVIIILLVVFIVVSIIDSIADQF